MGNNRRDEKKLNKLLEEDLKFKELVLREYLGDDAVDELLEAGVDLKDIKLKGEYSWFKRY